MATCSCGCGKALTGRQKRFKSDDHRNAFYSNARRIGAEKMGKLLAGAVSSPPEGNAILKELRDKILKSGVRLLRWDEIEQDQSEIRVKKRGHCRTWGNARLRRMYRALNNRGKELTTLEIHEATGEMSVSTTVSELRRIIQPTHDIVCRLLRVMPDKSKIYGYRMIKNEPV